MDDLLRNYGGKIIFTSYLNARDTLGITKVSNLGEKLISKTRLCRKNIFWINHYGTTLS